MMAITMVWTISPCRAKSWAKKSTATDCCEKQRAKAGRLRHQKQDRADDFQGAREVAEPLAKADGVEFSDHCWGAVDLCAAGSKENEPEGDFQDPKSDCLGTAGGCGLGD